MKRFALILALALPLCTSAWAQAPSGYTFETLNFPHDTFTQLLGINNSGVIAGYHGANINKGFRLIPPSDFMHENFPGSAQTQVIGINNKKQTDGFYIDTAGVTHGFIDSNGAFFTVDFPGTPFNQLLGLNDVGQAAGYYSNSSDNSTPDFPYIYDENGGVFEVITIPQAVNGAQATGINNSGHVSGFYIDSNQVNHGWFLVAGRLNVLDVPGASFTQALGINNEDVVVGVFLDSVGNSHGFWYKTGKGFHIVNDPHGVNTTLVNGLNDKGQLVGFYVDSKGNTDGFLATPK
jgi:hypothetical protein